MLLFILSSSFNYRATRVMSLIKILNLKFVSLFCFGSKLSVFNNRFFLYDFLFSVGLEFIEFLIIVIKLLYDLAYMLLNGLIFSYWVENFFALGGKLLAKVWQLTFKGLKLLAHYLNIVAVEKYLCVVLFAKCLTFWWVEIGDIFAHGLVAALLFSVFFLWRAVTHL